MSEYEALFRGPRGRWFAWRPVSAISLKTKTRRCAWWEPVLFTSRYIGAEPYLYYTYWVDIPENVRLKIRRLDGQE